MMTNMELDQQEPEKKGLGCLFVVLFVLFCFVAWFCCFFFPG